MSIETGQNAIVFIWIFSGSIFLYIHHSFHFNRIYLTFSVNFLKEPSESYKQNCSEVIVSVGLGSGVSKHFALNLK